MALREKIIVTLMALVLLWGAFTLIKGCGGKEKLATKGDAVFSVEAVSNNLQSLQANMPAPSVVAYLDKAGEPADMNPFADAGSSGGATNMATRVSEFIYSGHLKAGSREIVIINGQEYFEGETLSTGDYVVEKVSDKKVLLRGKVNGETKEVGLVEEATK